MRLYDEIIHDILTSLEKQDKHILPVGAAADPVSRDWQDAGKAMMILQSDMAYELGGHNLPAVGNTLVTTGKDFVPEDAVSYTHLRAHETAAGDHRGCSICEDCTGACREGQYRNGRSVIQYDPEYRIFSLPYLSQRVYATRIVF